MRRQLAVLAGEVDEAGTCWLQHAQLCRISGHNEAAGTATLEALAHNVTGAALERARLLWDRDQQHDAILKLKEVLSQSFRCKRWFSLRSETAPYEQLIFVQ